MGDIHYYSLVNSELRSGGQRVNWNIVSTMVHCCCVPRCSNRSDREGHLSFFRLLLKNKALLKGWIHRIGWKNLPLNPNMRVRSKHFEAATKRRLLSDEYPSVRLSVLTTSVKQKQRRPPKKRPSVELLQDGASVKVAKDPVYKNVSTQTINHTVKKGVFG